MRITQQDRRMQALIRRTQAAANHVPRRAPMVTTDPIVAPGLRYRPQPALETYSGDLRSRFPLAGRCAAPAKERTPPNTRTFDARHRYRRARWWATAKREVTIALVSIAGTPVCRRRAAV